MPHRNLRPFDSGQRVQGFQYGMQLVLLDYQPNIRICTYTQKLWITMWKTPEIDCLVTVFVSAFLN